MINLSESQRVTLQKLLRDRKSLMPHELCLMLCVQRSAAIAVLEKLLQQHPDKLTRKTLIYCNCGQSDNLPPSAAIPYGSAKPEMVKCSICDEEIVIDDAIGYDEIFLLKADIDLDKAACSQTVK